MNLYKTLHCLIIASFAAIHALAAEGASCLPNISHADAYNTVCDSDSIKPDCPLVVELVFSHPNPEYCPPPNNQGCDDFCSVDGPNPGSSCRMSLIPTDQTLPVVDPQTGDTLNGNLYKPFSIKVLGNANGTQLQMRVTPVEVDFGCVTWYFLIGIYFSEELIQVISDESFELYNSVGGNTITSISLNAITGLVQINNLLAGYEVQVFGECPPTDGRFCMQTTTIPGGLGQQLRGRDTDGPAAAQAPVSAKSQQAGQSNNDTPSDWAFTNPLQNQLELRFSQPLINEAELTLFDLRGAPLARYILDAGQMAYQFPINDLPAGAYAIRLRQGGHVQTRMAVKY